MLYNGDFPKDIPFLSSIGLDARKKEYYGEKSQVMRLPRK